MKIKNRFESLIENKHTYQVKYLKEAVSC